MSKLLQRLSDPVRSGVYRTRDEGAILDATRAASLDVAVVVDTVELGGAEVVCRRHRGGLARILFRGIADRLTQISPKPVLVAR